MLDQSSVPGTTHEWSSFESRDKEAGRVSTLFYEMLKFLSFIPLKQLFGHDYEHNCAV